MRAVLRVITCNENGDCPEGGYTWVDHWIIKSETQKDFVSPERVAMWRGSVLLLVIATPLTHRDIVFFIQKNTFVNKYFLKNKKSLRVMV